MRSKEISDLERFGLSPAEAQVYVALVRNGALGATALADATSVQRTAVYPILTSLTQKGMVEAGTGYGSRFTAVRPDEALASLVAREREEILQRERLAAENLLQSKRLAADLAKQLESLARPPENNGDLEVIQVLRDPRIATERFERLQLEAKQQVDFFVKAPILNPRSSNPTEEKALRRGVRYRAIYERAIVDAPEIKPFLSKWIAAGEEARVYDGELPHKVAIFDAQNILIPLVTPGHRGRILFIRHPQLAASLGMLFEFLWQLAKPIALPGRKRTTKPANAVHPKKKATPHSNYNLS
jgi:sugar-specific transcriptional regulator TrmB